MREQIVRLQRKMRELGIDVYVISDSDEHLSEYTGEHFHALEEFSGFTGGDGKLVVTAGRDRKEGSCPDPAEREDQGADTGTEEPEEGMAALWTDGRYFTQAEQELSGSGIMLMKMGEQKTPEISDWIGLKLPENGVLGFDGKCTSYAEGQKLIGRLAAEPVKEESKADAFVPEKGIRHPGRQVITGLDLAGMVWEDRPAQKITPCWILGEKYSGKSAAEKIADTASSMRKHHARLHILTALDDIAWLLNLRAHDIPNNPVFMAYLMISLQECEEAEKSAKDPDVYLYTDSCHLTPETEKYLEDLHVAVMPYHQIYEDIRRIENRQAVLLDKKRANYEIVSSIPEGVRVIDHMNPETEAKCCKNKTEIENIRIAQHKDGVALTKFMYWFKTKGLEQVKDKNRSKENGPGLTEWTAALKLHEFRAEQAGFMEESFPTISAYGPNAAMAHYMPDPDPERDTVIEPAGLYLVDSGGQYPEGTTDVTRTWSCGPISREEREAVTLAVIANLRLADARFPEGTSGTVIDYPARELFWRRGMNYNHGTGHGVGHVLNVHEAPVGIRYRALTPEGAWPLKEGMYLSDEPGFYKAGAFGVRIENLLLVCHDYTNEYGRFMKFETVTLCPIDKSCLDTSLMTGEDIRLLNRYHQRVYEELCDDMNEEEREWLYASCEPLVHEEVM